MTETCWRTFFDSGCNVVSALYFKCRVSGLDATERCMKGVYWLIFIDIRTLVVQQSCMLSQP